MNSKVKAPLILAGVFVLGGVAGVFGGRVLAFKHMHSVMDGSDARLHFRVETLRNELDLDQEQAKKIEAIYKSTDPEREQAMSACRPGLDDLRARTDAQITEVLRPEQRPRYDELVKKRSAGRRP